MLLDQEDMYVHGKRDQVRNEDGHKHAHGNDVLYLFGHRGKPVLKFRFEI